MYQSHTPTRHGPRGEHPDGSPAGAAQSESRDLPATGDVLGGRYRIERRIALGGMGVVYEATNVATARTVALKWLRPNRHSVASMRRLVREARAAGRVRHPNIVTVYDVGEHQGRLFLVMELLRGETLAAHLTEHGPMDLGQTLSVMLPVMHAVQAAHRAGVVHRDLKPSNILLHQSDATAERTPVVVDFGISKIDDPEAAPADGLSQTGTVLGTPYYMAPEQLDEHRVVDTRADVYALGVILYELLSGVRPYEAQSLSTLTLQVHRGDHAPIGSRCPDLPAPVCAAVERALRVDPEERFGSVAELIDALRPHAEEPTPADADPVTVRRRRPVALLGAIGMAGAVVAAIAWFGASARQEPESARRNASVAPESARALAVEHSAATSADAPTSAVASPPKTPRVDRPGARPAAARAPADEPWDSRSRALRPRTEAPQRVTSRAPGQLRAGEGNGSDGTPEPSRGADPTEPTGREPAPEGPELRAAAALPEVEEPRSPAPEEGLNERRPVSEAPAKEQRLRQVGLVPW